MFKKYVIPLFALIGLIAAVRTVIGGNTPPPVAQPLIEPARGPFKHFAAGSGIIEPSSENIAVATSVGGVVDNVPVSIGQRVKQGAVLFVIDSRDLYAEMAVRSKDLNVAQANLFNAKSLLAMRVSISNKGAVSGEDLEIKSSAVRVAQAQIEQIKERLNQIAVEIDRRIIKSPRDAQILQIKVRAGEFAPAQQLAQPLMVIGDTSSLFVRVDIDENDAWRIKAGAKGMASLRGNKEIKSELEFMRFEPFVIPKRSLTGDSNERVDTRVLQIIYRIKESSAPVFVGQLMDVFIEAQA